jgi:RNA polymerase subunit RPABC4/transcription elongation factor Spt4
MKVCQGCGAELVRRHQQVYCSNPCQRAHERRLKTEAWLHTGVAVLAGAPRGHYVRRYLLEQQSHACAICGGPETWNGADLVLVLDHVDGDSTNNRRDNLRMVCPNCDSQLPTYKMRNKGKGRHSRRERYADGKSY